MKDPRKVTQGKKNKAAGRAFELKVRKDLESKGWIVAKWTNNVEWCKDGTVTVDLTQANPSKKIIGKALTNSGKLIPAKHKFNFFNKVMSMGTGFPDFIAFRKLVWQEQAIITTLFPYEVIGVESKINGYLDKDEKEKCEWLLYNNIFSKILVAKKGEKRGSIEYKEFRNE